MANSNIRFEKILDTLPQTLTPNTTYFLKNTLTGSLTQYLSDSLGQALVQVSGKTPSYNDLTDKPSIPSTPGDIGLGNVDNTSDASKPISTATQTALDGKIDSTKIGAASGIAGLDADKKLLAANLPDGVVGSLTYKAKWDTTTPLPLANSSNKGWYYVVSASATDGSYWKDDWVVSNGTTWDRINNTGAVSSVAGMAGVVTLAKGDVGLGNVDNTSDADKPVSTAQKTALDAKVATSQIGISQGICDLDVNKKVPITRIPDSILGSLSYQGPYDMVNILPTASSSNKGWYYIASNASPVNGYVKGDWAVSNGTSWDRIDNTSAVQSVAGMTGAVTLAKGDVGLDNVDNTSDADKPVSTAQKTALDAKAPLASPTFTGTPLAPTATAGTNTTQVATTEFVTTAISTKAPITTSLTTKTTAYTLVATDKGTRISTTANITINKDVFVAGDSIIICNANTSATPITITIGTGLTCYLDGNTSPKTTLTLVARGAAAILFDSPTVVNAMGKSVS